MVHPIHGSTHCIIRTLVFIIYGTQCIICAPVFLVQTVLYQGIGIKGKEMALVWHEKASRTALQTSSVNFTHTLLVQTHTHDVSAPCIIRTLVFIIHGTPCINAVLYSLFIVHPVLYGLHSAVSKTSI